jgi:hypothetical protein
MNTAQQWIEQLSLQRHPEGGWFKEVYRSPEIILKAHLPSRYSGDRHFGTSIYFMLEGGDFSAYHRLQSDEIWFYHDGCPLWLYIIDETGNLTKILIRKNVAEGACLQYAIPAGCWFAGKPVDEQSFTLLGCTVSPGFDFSDFELATRENLIKMHPQHSAHITQFTR